MNRIALLTSIVLAMGCQTMHPVLPDTDGGPGDSLDSDGDFISDVEERRDM